MAVKTFDEILVDDVDHYLNVFGIEGIYQPGVLDREIKMIVRYTEDDGQAEPVVRHRGPMVYINVADDTVKGISADEFEQGKVINMPPRKLAEARDSRLRTIIKQDAGMITIEAH